MRQNHGSAEITGYLVTGIVVVAAAGLGAYFLSADFTAVRYTAERQRSVAAMVPGGMPPLPSGGTQSVSFTIGR